MARAASRSRVRESTRCDAWRRIARHLATTLAFAASIPTAIPQAQSSASFAEEDFLLLEVRLEPHLLSEAIPAYRGADDILLPLCELARVLSIALTADVDKGEASGFIIDEERTFHLDAVAGTVTLAGQSKRVEASAVVVQPDDIYASRRLIAQWLPVELDANLSRMVLTVRAREPLPLQERLQREQRNINLSRSTDGPSYSEKAVPYKMFAAPSIDQTVGVEMRRGGGAQVNDAFFSSYFTGDLLGMESKAYVSGRQHGEIEKRITLGRSDPDAALLGPLRASSFAFGSVPVPAARHISTAAAFGDGFAVSNYPLTRPLLFDMHTLQGDLLPGWDVELYQNGALAGYQQAGSDGRYRFDDVQLVPGANDFRLVFRGPQGQHREERQTVLLEDSLLAPGDFNYRFAASEPDEGGRAGAAQFDWGLTKGLSANAGWYMLPVGDVSERYVDVGLRANWAAMIMSGQYVRSDDGGDLAELSLKTRLRGLSIGVSHARLQEFSSDVFQPSSDPVSEQTEVRVTGSMPAPGAARLPFSLDLSHQRTESGREHIELSGRVSALLGGTWWTNQLRAISFGGQEAFDGVLQWGRGFGTFGLRGSMTYAVAPHTDLTALALAAERRLAAGYVINSGITRTFLTPDTRYHVGVSKQVGQFGLGVNGAYSESGELTFSAQFFASLGIEPRTASWVSQSVPMADTGFASVRVFLDENLNGRMDRGEQALQDIGFTVNGAQRPLRTDAGGVAYLRGLPTRQGIDLAVDERTFEDPQWLPALEGVRLVPRAGRAAEVDFPVIRGGEVDGVVYLVADEKRRPAGGLTLELLSMDPSTEPIRRARTASDGFYIVELIPPGKYLLRIAPEEIKNSKVTDTGERIITISAEGDLISGVDMFVIPRRAQPML